MLFILTNSTNSYYTTYNTNSYCFLLREGRGYMEYFREEIRRIMICVNMIDGIYTMGARKIGIKYNTLALFYALDDGLPHS